MALQEWHYRRWLCHGEGWCPGGGLGGGGGGVLVQGSYARVGAVEGLLHYDRHAEMGVHLV